MTPEVLATVIFGTIMAILALLALIQSWYYRRKTGISAIVEALP